MKNYKLTIEIEGDGEEIINKFRSIRDTIMLGADYDKNSELTLEERNQFFKGLGWELKEIKNHD